MTKDTTDLFYSLALGPNTLRNRIVMAPMTRNCASTGLIITEASQVSSLAGIARRCRISSHARHSQPATGGRLRRPRNPCRQRLPARSVPARRRNQRDDDNGGSIANRSRLLMEIVGAVSQLWDMSQIGVRISPENCFNDMRDSDPQTTFDYLAKHLGNKGIGYLHVLEGDMMGAERKVEYRQIKQNFGGIYMANSGYDYNRARNALRRGEADLVSFGVPCLANPDLAERFRTGARLNVPDQATFYGGDAHGYTDYPFMET